MCYNWGLKFFNQEELKSHISENLEVGSYICPKCEEGYELGMKLKKHMQEGTSKLAPAPRKIGFGLPKLFVCGGL